jgi:hypothetical protein
MYALGCTQEQLDRHFYYFEDPPATLDDAPDIRDMIDDLKPALVVYDSHFGFLAAADLDENYGRDVAAWFDAFAPPTLPCATLILDHPPKSGSTARGSSRKLDAVDVSWELKGDFSDRRVGPVTLKLKKSRDGGLPEVVKFTAGGTPLRFDRGTSRNLKPHERTFSHLEDGMSLPQWRIVVEDTGVSRRTFYLHVEKLEKDGLIVHREDDTYARADV